MSIPYKKILLPLDGSEFAAQALPHAEAVASAHGAALILFEVINDPLRIMATPPGVGSARASGTSIVGIGPARADDAQHQQAMDEAQRNLGELVTSLRHRKIDAVADIDSGDPATCIVDYASAHDVDLIVMNTHGRTGIQRWAYGSVTSKVLQAAHCAVLVVRPD
ncbi:universal stress protein [Chloroflexi bacterium TSY]|nr:universal stress protein [Chloroflexi bacterium TSY]